MWISALQTPSQASYLIHLPDLSDNVTPFLFFSLTLWWTSFGDGMMRMFATTEWFESQKPLFYGDSVRLCLLIRLIHDLITLLAHMLRPETMNFWLLVSPWLRYSTANRSIVAASPGGSRPYILLLKQYRWLCRQTSQISIMSAAMLPPEILSLLKGTIVTNYAYFAALALLVYNIRASFAHDYAPDKRPYGKPASNYTWSRGLLLEYNHILIWITIIWQSGQVFLGELVSSLQCPGPLKVPIPRPNLGLLQLGYTFP